MKIAIASDHGGYELKERFVKHLEAKQYGVIDMGTDSMERVDFPEYAFRVAKCVASGEASRGVLVCGSGIGMCIAANKIKGVYAAMCNDLYSAKMSRLHNNSNVMTIGGRVVGPDLAMEILDVWLATPFLEDRYKVRIEMIEREEKGARSC